jgi:hypothetical protein
MLTWQIVYLGASGLAGIAGFTVLRLYVFTARRNQVVHPLKQREVATVSVLAAGWEEKGREKSVAVMDPAPAQDLKRLCGVLTACEHPQGRAIPAMPSPDAQGPILEAVFSGDPPKNDLRGPLQGIRGAVGRGRAVVNRKKGAAGNRSAVCLADERELNLDRAGGSIRVCGGAVGGRCHVVGGVTA